jgi:hypothetical protein
LQLIRLLEPLAGCRDRVGSLGLLAAAAVLTIPYERMRTKRFLHTPETDGALASALKQLEKVPFFHAPLWQCQEPGRWWQSRIVSTVENVDGWRDEDGRHPLCADA